MIGLIVKTNQKIKISIKCLCQCSRWSQTLNCNCKKIENKNTGIKLKFNSNNKIWSNRNNFAHPGHSFKQFGNLKQFDKI